MHCGRQHARHVSCAVCRCKTHAQCPEASLPSLSQARYFNRSPKTHLSRCLCASGATWGPLLPPFPLPSCFPPDAAPSCRESCLLTQRRYRGHHKMPGRNKGFARPFSATWQAPRDLPEPPLYASLPLIIGPWWRRGLVHREQVIPCQPRILRPLLVWHSSGIYADSMMTESMPYGCIEQISMASFASFVVVNRYLLC